MTLFSWNNEVRDACTETSADFGSKRIKTDCYTETSAESEVLKLQNRMEVLHIFTQKTHKRQGSKRSSNKLKIGQRRIKNAYKNKFQ